MSDSSARAVLAMELRSGERPRLELAWELGIRDAAAACPPEVRPRVLALLDHPPPHVFSAATDGERREILERIGDLKRAAEELLCEARSLASEAEVLRKIFT